MMFAQLLHSVQLRQLRSGGGVIQLFQRAFDVVHNFLFLRDGGCSPARRLAPPPALKLRAASFLFYHPSKAVAWRALPQPCGLGLGFLSVMLGLLSRRARVVSPGLYLRFST